MRIEEAISQDADVMSGASVFAGTRVPVSHLFEFIEDGATLDEFLKSFPTVSREQAQAVLHDAFDEYRQKLA